MKVFATLFVALACTAAVLLLFEDPRGGESPLDLVQADADKTVVEQLQQSPSEFELGPNAKNCQWSNGEWHCVTSDYDLRVVYPAQKDNNGDKEAPGTRTVAIVAAAPPVGKPAVDVAKPSPTTNTQIIHIYLPPEPDCSRQKNRHLSSCRRKRAPARPLPPPKNKAVAANARQTRRQVRKAAKKVREQRRRSNNRRSTSSSSSSSSKSSSNRAAAASTPSSPTPSIARQSKKKQSTISSSSSSPPTKEKLWKEPRQRREPKIRPPPLPEPWSPPDNLWLWWGGDVDKWESAERIRHLVKLGQISGGEYRDSHFLKSFHSQEFRDLTLTCCNVLLFPPLAHGFPIFADDGRMQHRISRFISNGNTMIFTGLRGILFINRIFRMEIEPVGYSPGPFVQYQVQTLPPAIKSLKDTLRQEGMHVAVVSQRSLPLGTQIYYASPQGTSFFAIKYCEVNNPKIDEPPIKVIPRDCPKWERKGIQCGCGNIVFLGFDWHESDNEHWNDALRASLGLVIGKSEDN